MVCRICLRSDNFVTANIDDVLVEFHHKLCEDNIESEENPVLKFCPICEHQLRKFYNFRQKCRRANTILKTWRLTGNPKSLPDLHERFPPSNLTFKKNASPIFMEFNYTDIELTEWDIKLEKDDFTKTENNMDAEEFKSNISVDLDSNKNEDKISFKIEDNSYCEVFNDYDDSDIDYEPKRKKSKCKSIDSFDRNKTTKEKLTRSRSRKQLLRIKNDNIDVSEKITTTTKEKVTSSRSRKKILCIQNDEKITTKKQRFTSNQVKLKERILKLLQLGEFKDLGDNVKMNEELFLKMFDKCDKSGLKSMLLVKPGSSDERKKLRKFLLCLFKNYNPEYEDIFTIEVLDTDAKKLDEFNRRKLSKEYLDAEYKCERCYKVFEVKRLLIYHERWHESAGEHECEICAMRFESRKALAQHRKTNHFVVYRCKLCPLLTYNQTVMVNHYNQHKGMEYSCPVCLSVFSNKNTCNNHRRQAHKTSHICPFCARSFVSEKGLYFHKRLKHRDEYFETKSENAVSCDKCDAVLTSQEVLLTHVRQVHEMSQTLQCFTCKEIFSTLDELKKHKIEQDHRRRPRKTITKPDDSTQSEITDEKQTCSECDRSFNSRKSYLYHWNTSHKTNRIHKCGFCQAKFTSAVELESHRSALSHHRKTRYVRKQQSKPGNHKRLKCKDPEKPFEKCELCSELVSLARTNTMYQHFQAAHPDTPYGSVYGQPHNRHLCHQCGKTFKDLTFFLDHANLHSGAKPYACQQCPRTFASLRHLRMHEARHQPPSHQCRLCGKMFRSAGNLFAHRRCHIGDRRFKCEICAKGFLHQAALNEHVRGVHNHIRRPRKCREK